MPSHDRGDLDRRIADVRSVLAQVQSHLSPHWVDSAEELLANDEPNEALIQIAWGISSDEVDAPDQVHRFIQANVGDPRDLPGGRS